MDALRLESPELLRATVHPAVLAKLDDSNRADFEMQEQKELKKKPVTEYKFKVAALDPKNPLFMDEYLDYAVQPTHLVRVSFKTAKHSHTTRMWLVAEKEGTWYVVIPLPDMSVPGMRKMVEETSAKKEADQKKIDELYYRADPAELTQFREMLRQGQKMQAIERCRRSMSLEHSEAKAFLQKVDSSV